jgi:hypothetical protein
MMIAMRQGGLPTYLTVASNQIVAGSNNVTGVATTGYSSATGIATSSLGPLVPLLLSSPATTAAIAMTGVVSTGAALVACTLTRTVVSGNEIYSLVPTIAPGAPIACPAGSLFIPDEAETYADHVVFLWPGSNDVTLWLTSGGRQVTLDNIAACVAKLTALRKRFVLIMPTLAATFPTGNAYHTGFNQVRAALAALYPDNFVDIHNVMVTQGLAMAGITPTSQDTTDIANDSVPASLRDVGDDIHYNATAETAVVNPTLSAFVSAKGWLL